MALVSDASQVSEVELLERLVLGGHDEPVTDLRRHVCVFERRLEAGVADETSFRRTGH